MTTENQTSQVAVAVGGPSPTVTPPELATGPLQRTGEESLGDWHLDFAAFHEGYVRHYITLADTKSGLMFGSVIGLITFLTRNDHFKKAISSPNCSWIFCEATLAMVFLILSAASAAYAIAPRRRGSGEGIVFFDAVAAYPSAEAYVEAIAHRSKIQLTAARLRHCFDVSRACSRKYDMLRRAIVFAAIGLITSLNVLWALR